MEEFKQNFVKLYQQYTKACAAKSKELKKDEKAYEQGVTPSFDGFIAWLENGEVSA